MQISVGTYFIIKITFHFSGKLMDYLTKGIGAIDICLEENKVRSLSHAIYKNKI